MFSIKLGENNEEEANKVLNNSFLLLLIFGLLITSIGQIFLEPILKAFGASSEIMPYAKEYMRIIFIGASFSVISLGMNSFLRAIGKPKIAMVSMLISAGLNLALDPLFIFVFNWGMFGAALATIIAQFLSMAWILFYFLSKKSNQKLSPSLMKADLALIGKNNLFWPSWLCNAAV